MAQLEVLYNADCPICRREIEHYKRISGDDLAYVEITAKSAADWGLSEDQAAKQLHVRRGAQVSVGVEAFVAIWRQLPYFWVLAIFDAGASAGMMMVAVVSFRVAARATPWA